MRIPRFIDGSLEADQRVRLIELKRENEGLRSDLLSRSADLAASIHESKLVRDRCSWLERRVNDLEKRLGRYALAT